MQTDQPADNPAVPPMPPSPDGPTPSAAEVHFNEKVLRDDMNARQAGQGD